jgi:2-methylcitrate dehydratase PrpD
MPEEVERIDLGLNSAVIMHCGSYHEPHEVIQAQFSLPFSLAIRLIKDSNDLSLYMDRQLWRNPKVMELAHKVHFYAVPEMKGERKYACSMRITLTRGRILEGNLNYAKGSYQNPLTTEELRGKFRKLASTVLPTETIEKVIGRVENMEQMKDLAQLVSLLQK